MRALCEACGQPQPPDWSPGDQCVHCGKGVRRDVRCFWCAKWTPAAKFCRSCGAETVDPRLYGAARMLKDAGTDRFTVPKQLAAFDPDQVENFSRIYQRHSTAVARHVDELRFLERFLRQKPWSAALEDQLVPQLPWPEAQLAQMSGPALPAGDDLSTAKAIHASTPFPATRSLAALVRLKLDDWSAHREAISVFHTEDPTLRAEAALVLTSWRVLSAVGRPRDDGRAVFEELQRSPFKIEAAVRLGLLGHPDPELLREALASPEPETAFGAALVLGDVDRLRAALNGGDLEKVAAGHKLIALGVIQAVVETVEKSPLEIQQELVEGLVRRKGPAPEAADTLLKIVETTEDKTLRERAARVLCRQLRPDWALRIARAAKDDRSIYQSLLQAEDLPPESALELGDFLLQGGRFAMHQYGLSSVAEKGRMPFTFVPTRFATADEKTQGELLRFAEVQLGHGGDEELHRFVLGVAFGPHPAKIRAAAWWVLHRGYRAKGEYRGEGPFKLEKHLIEGYFGSVGAFVPKLAAVLRDRDTLKEVGYYEMIAHLLSSADDDAIQAFQDDGAGEELLDALLAGMRGDYWPNTMESMAVLASHLGSHPRWNAKTQDALRALGRKGSYHYDKALRRVELAAHGIPEESEWPNLPPGFVPARFAAASSAGRLELLKAAEQQLIHAKEELPDLLRFLLDVALRPGDPAVRAAAAEVHRERARGAFERFPLRKAAVEQAYGSYADFLRLLPEVLREPGDLTDFLIRLFGDPKPGDAEELAEELDAGKTLIAAMLELAADEGQEARLRREIVDHLEHSGAQRAWRTSVIQGLGRVGGDLAMSARRVVERLRAAEPPAPERHVSYGVPEPDDDDAPMNLERLGKDYQEAIFRLMAGPGTAAAKKKQAAKLSKDYQEKRRELQS